MAALDFPASPTLNQSYVANGKAWKWNGQSWVVIPASVLTGAGDMNKTIYDTNADGVVDYAASTPWSGLTGKPSTITTVETTASAYGLSLLDDTDAAAARTTLGLGSLATKSTVTSSDITDLTVATADLADGAVTTAKILDSNVTTAKIADSNVTNAKIATDAVTTAKILDANVTAAKIAAAAVTVAKISATGTPGSTTYLRGDGAWVTPAMDVLGTLTTTSGTTQTLSGLVLTPYKRLHISVQGVSFATAVALQLSSNNISLALGSAADAFYGFISIDLKSGGTFQSLMAVSSALSVQQASAASSSNLLFQGKINIDQSTTSISFAGNGATFDAGQIEIMGIR